MNTELEHHGGRAAASGDGRANRPRRKGRPGVTVVASLGILGALLALGVGPRMQQAKVLKAEQKEGEGATIVTVATPIHSLDATDLVLPGNIEAVEQTAINARTSGYVKKRYVDIGARVKAGQVLAEIESPEIDQQLLQARAEAYKMESELAHANAAVKMARTAVETAKAEADKLEANVASAGSDAAHADASVLQARADQSRAQAGVSVGQAEVAKMNANLGQARSALARATAALQQARQDVSTKKANLGRAKADVEIARKTAERWATLVKQGAVSGQEADEKQAQYEARRADAEAAAAAVSSSEANVAAAQASVEASKSDVEAAQASIGSSQASVLAAEAGANSGLANVEAQKASAKSSQSSIDAAKSAWQAAVSRWRSSKGGVVAAQLDVQAAAAAWKSAKANVQRYSVMQSFERVTAPYDGVITARNVDAGALISGGTGSGGGSTTEATMKNGLFGLARTDTLRIQVNVPQSFIASIKQGQKAQVQVREFPHREFAGEITHVAGALDSGSRTLLAEIRLVNPDNILVPGMYANVLLTPGGAARPIRVPANTLMFGTDGAQVVVITPDKTARVQKVTLGRDNGEDVEVTAGLKGDEQLVENPTDSLTTGTAVQIEEHAVDATKQPAGNGPAGGANGAKPGGNVPSSKPGEAPPAAPANVPPASPAGSAPAAKKAP